MPSNQRRARTGYLDSTGQRIRYRVRGDGPPLLMLHGIGAPLGLWRPLESRLGDLTTITVDPPGAGRSTTPRGSFGMRDYAAVMDDLVAHLGFGSVNVLGLSLGGMIAQELAHRHPDRVERLVLASTSCGWGAPRVSWGPLAALAQPHPVTRRRRPSPGDAGGSLLRDWAREPHRPSLRGYAVGLRAAFTWSSLPWLEELPMPVLAITGDDDPVVPPENSRIIATKVPRGRLEVLEGRGHLAVLRDPQRASRLIDDFLREE